MKYLIALITGLLFYQPIVANAQSFLCSSDKAKFTHFIYDNYTEASIGYGLSNQGHIIEVYVSRDHKTWTLTYTLPNGRICLIASGRSWEPIEHKAPVPLGRQALENKPSRRGLCQGCG